MSSITSPSLKPDRSGSEKALFRRYWTFVENSRIFPGDHVEGDLQLPPHYVPDEHQRRTRSSWSPDWNRIFDILAAPA